MLRNRTVKTTAYTHWLQGKLPKAIDSENLSHLLKGVKQGNEISINVLIEGHMRLAASIVGRYKTVGGQAIDTDMCLSAAFEGIVAAVNKIRKDGLSHEGVTAYITTYIHNYIQRQGIDPYVQKQSRLQHDFKIQDSRILETYDELSAACRDESDATIVDMVGRGYTQTEIAKQLKVTQPAVALRIKNIRTRLLERKNAVA